MRILYVTQYFSAAPIHASEVTTYEIVKRLVERGHKVTVVSARSPGIVRICEDSADRCRVIKIFPLPEFCGKWYDGIATFFTLTLAHVPTIIETLYVNQFHEHFDAIISMFHPTHMATVSAYLLSLILKLPLIVKIHDLVIETIRPVALKRVYHIILGKMNFRVLRRSNAILAQSLELMDIIKELGAIDEEKIAFFPNGVDTNLFRPSIGCGRLRQKLGLEGKVVVLFLGGLYKARHPELLIKALPDIIRRVKYLKLLFVGEGPLESELSSLAMRLGVSDCVKFVGSIRHSVVPKFISLADVTVGPLSLTYDPTTHGSVPLKVLEYMACGKPVVVSRGQVSESLIIDRYNGLLFEPGVIGELSSAIVSLIEDKRFASYIGCNALRHVEEFYSWDSLIPKLETLLKSVTGSNTKNVC